ncbi:hypothetical protein GGD56_001919 [Rhizobium mongolense]|uniref:Uncharacterized protein n=2 Tax=Rhizobium mongolense TaxID=57676 RepID=A0ABR6IKE4_9HYPH|nr:hypothetical protein [Rhizobium mongolense]TVZ64758.1 hypothetical protein BCL32_5024 [Rhizobium mongolense USDA 1844]
MRAGMMRQPPVSNVVFAVPPVEHHTETKDTLPIRGRRIYYTPLY